MSRGGGVPPLVAAAVGSCGTGRVTFSFEKYAEVRGGGWLATRFGATVRDGGGREVSSEREEPAEIECAIGISALVATAVCSLCARQITLLFEEYAEVGGGGRLASFIGSRVGNGGGGEVSSLREQTSQVE